MGRCCGGMHGVQLVNTDQNTLGGRTRDIIMHGSSLLTFAWASDFARKVVGTLAVRIVVQGLGLASSILIARVLGPDGRGLVAVATTMAAMGVQFANLGLHVSNNYFVSRDPSLLRPQLGNTLVASVGLGGVATFIAGILFYFFPRYSLLQGPVLVLSVAAIPLGLAFLLLQNLLLGMHRVRAYNAVEAGNVIVSLTLLALLIVAGNATVWSVYGVSIAAQAMCVGSMIWLLARKGNRPTLSIGLMKLNLHYGLKTYAACLFAFSLLKSDQLLVQHYLGSTATGFYSIASSVVDMLLMMPAVFSLLLFPKLSSMHSTEEKWRFTRERTGIVVLAVAIAVAGTATLAEPVISLLYGPQFLPAVPAFRALAIAAIFLAINSILMNFLASIGNPTFVVYVYAAAFVCNFGLNVWLIPWLGIVGASISSVVAYGMVSCMAYLYIRGVVVTGQG